MPHAKQRIVGILFETGDVTGPQAHSGRLAHEMVRWVLFLPKIGDQCNRKEVPADTKPGVFFLAVGYPSEKAVDPIT